MFSERQQEMFAVFAILEFALLLASAHIAKEDQNLAGLVFGIGTLLIGVGAVRVAIQHR